ncbi:Hypothetical protein GbCGDNIH1_8012 [Granulibacter bethesdensis CGDNIH1]|uniref:Uncharacterized protein n=1 Tax=Granulibacter bethesdensis (strain ATCC BAA-1260 / CGDNIH1) TaxID=391165 RepID=A0A286M2Y2_GRABC|nr:Hypothetical protein GbCGDNIH5_8012 [Granulibacter bethesdensis]APH64095.1 Hypothetical protein GbCGDNIH1I4_8012 [Granulibacter bethesdensis]ASV62381.1 Hypothetical protein GbCGDNIH1_8012 [Granulibacter bethesdensis CGDNIH1]
MDCVTGTDSVVVMTEFSLMSVRLPSRNTHRNHDRGDLWLSGGAGFVIFQRFATRLTLQDEGFSMTDRYHEMRSVTFF